MSTNSRYPKRTRGIANTGNDHSTMAAANNVDNAPTTSSASAAASRSAFGNIAHITNRDRDGNDDGEQPKSKKTRPVGGITAGVERVRGGRSKVATAKEIESAELDQKPHARGGAGKKYDRDEKAKSKKVEEVKKEAAITKKVAVKIEVKKEKSTKDATKRSFVVVKDEAAVKEEVEDKKKGATKRLSGDGNGTTQTQPRGRTSKRVRKSSDSDTAAEEEEPATTRRVTRSCSLSNRKKSALVREVIVDIIPAGDNRIIPQDFGLERSSFDRQNFTRGIAYYDASERTDPLLCKDYVTDILQHYFHEETQNPTEPYMDYQVDINVKMRAILVDWLVEVHMKFKLNLETLYLCVNIIDRYCSLEQVLRTKLQLIGVTSLLLACKHEEIYPPEVRDCVYITDRAYDRQEVLDMEQTILRVLNWRLYRPTAYSFLDRFLSLTKASPMTRHAATYYLERTLQEHELLNFRPSMVCASAVILALNNSEIPNREEEYVHGERPGLPKILMEYTGFDKDQLRNCMTLVAEKIDAPVASSSAPVASSRRQLRAVSKKYEHKHYMAVSTLKKPSTTDVRTAEDFKRC